MKLTNALTLTFSRASRARLVWNAIQPELDPSTKGDRAKMAFHYDEDHTIHFDITAKDPTAMRASVNSILLVLQVVEDTLDLRAKE